MARSVTVIPAAPQRVTVSRGQVVEKKIRVAAYCRVSTDHEDQIHSFDAQVDYYTKYIKEHENYELAGIYADEGISGTNTKKREQFKRMIADCKAGKVDLVITKSISRFARNTQDCLQYSRMLKNLGIGIIFEKENINTLDSTGELLFTILSSLAQDESRNISENCKWGIRTKFRNGQMHLNTYKFLGYDKNEEGKLIINKEQAKTVARIYEEFLWGINPQQIAKELEEEGVPGCCGQTKWYTTTVIGILKNEKHKGDALLQKTYTADFLTKRQVKNNGEIMQVYVEDSHEGIVDKFTWEVVQAEFRRREEFMKKHGLTKYFYGSECNPFTSKVFCGECGHSYTKHSWKNRGVEQWQCKNHRTNGRLTCKNQFVDAGDLEKAFVQAYNELITEKLNRERWKKQLESEDALGSYRASQMLELLEQGTLSSFAPEIAQLTVIEVTVLGAKKFEFEFVDGSKINVTI